MTPITPDTSTGCSFLDVSNLVIQSVTLYSTDSAPCVDKYLTGIKFTFTDGSDHTFMGDTSTEVSNFEVKGEINSFSLWEDGAGTN